MSLRSGRSSFAPGGRVLRHRIGTSGRIGLWIAVLGAVLVLLGLLSVTIGSRAVVLSDLMWGLRGETGTIGQAAVALRVPRTLLALLAGAALGVAGGVMQGVTRNPLADPGILGVNAGAALAVVVGVAFFRIASADAYIGCAVFGAGVAAVFVYAVSLQGPGGATPLKLALSGAATSVACSCLVIAVVLPRGDIAGGIQEWQVGGVGGATFARILPVLPFLALGLLLSFASASRLNLLALGEEMAAGLGERVAVARALAAAGAILLCGATTAVCGPIGFVGLVVPHVCRLLIGSDHRLLLPVSGLAGSALLVLADIVGRVIARPAEIDAGLVVAFLGAPFFVWIVRRRRLRAL